MVCGRFPLTLSVPTLNLVETGRDGDDVFFIDTFISDQFVDQIIIFRSVACLLSRDKLSGLHPSPTVIVDHSISHPTHQKQDNHTLERNAQSYIRTYAQSYART